MTLAAMSAISQPPPIQVIGVGLEGAAGLSPARYQQVLQADILVGGQRHLAYFPDSPAERWPLTDLQLLLTRLQACLAQAPPPNIVILTSGDPLYFGLGRLLLTAIPATQLAFYPHVSSVQLAFSELKVPWQDACVVSIHGRDWQPLIDALKRCEGKIAILGDPSYDPSAIATLIQSLDLPCAYQIWLCENLGSPEARLQPLTMADLAQPLTVADLHILVLIRQSSPLTPPLGQLTPPLLGLADSQIESFPDRPGLMTKREVRVLVLAELALQPQQVIWDIGAGTGAVSLEIARLVPSAQLFAIEKTAVGVQLIQRNCQRYGVSNVQAISGVAPAATQTLPNPDRVFIGGSGGQLHPILSHLVAVLRPGGQITLTLTTLENLSQLMTWLAEHRDWQQRFLQVNLARSTQIGAQQRFSPLNPVTIATLWQRR